MLLKIFSTKLQENFDAPILGYKIMADEIKLEKSTGTFKIIYDKDTELKLLNKIDEEIDFLLENEKSITKFPRRFKLEILSLLLELLAVYGYNYNDWLSGNLNFNLVTAILTLLIGYSSFNCTRLISFKIINTRALKKLKLYSLIKNNSTMDIIDYNCLEDYDMKVLKLVNDKIKKEN